MVDKICMQCQVEYFVPKYREKITKCCSRKCASKLNYKNIVFTHEHKIGNQFRKGKRPANAFVKGGEPWNKGVKGLHLSPESEFKKGCVSNRAVPVGTIKARTDKGGNVRNYIKVAEPSQWQENAIYVWEMVNGIVPTGYVIHHKDRIPSNDVIENLQMLTRAEHINEHRGDK